MKKATFAAGCFGALKKLSEKLVALNPQLLVIWGAI